jgi:hypothetical protein
MTRTWHRVRPFLAVVLVAGACTVTTPASSLPSAPASTARQVATPSAPSPTATPLQVNSPSPTASATLAGWSEPTLIKKGQCFGLTAAIDTLGRYHVASTCDGGIRYLTSADGIDWTETSFVPSIDRLEQDPQLTLDGDTLYLAYSVLAPTDGGCGDDGLQEVGVYTRSLKPPSRTWSEPVRVGAKGDRVQSFRVSDGVLHLTVIANESAGPLYYESQSGPNLAKMLIPDAVTTSLRVGDDGHARVAYAIGHAIRYARVDGTKLSTTTVAASTETYLQSPSLVLGPGDHAYMVWTQNADGGGGCVGPEPSPVDGVYFATDASGSWKTTRLTATPGEASLTLDPSSGRIEVVVNHGSGLTQYESVGGDDWTSTMVPGTTGLNGPLIRMNPVTGSVNIVAFDYDKGLYLVTRP